IGKIALEEETRFRETLERGVKMLDEQLEHGGDIPGGVAVKLYDTYGFPIDLTRVIAARRGVSVDEAGFEAALEAERRRSDFNVTTDPASEAVYHKISERVGATKFLGYETTEAESKIVALLAEGAEAEVVGPYSTRVAVVTAETPFYGEQGGQVGD